VYSKDTVADKIVAKCALLSHVNVTSRMDPFAISRTNVTVPINFLFVLIFLKLRRVTSQTHGGAMQSMLVPGHKRGTAYRRQSRKAASVDLLPLYSALVNLTKSFFMSGREQNKSQVLTLAVIITKCSNRLMSLSLSRGWLAMPLATSVSSPPAQPFICYVTT